MTATGWNQAWAKGPEAQGMDVCPKPAAKPKARQWDDTQVHPTSVISTSPMSHFRRP